MPRFHFNVRDGVSIDDLVGTDLADIYAARLEAVRFSGEVLKDNADTFWVRHEWRVEVTDDTGLILFAIHISAVDAPALHEWKPTTPKAAKALGELANLTPLLSYWSRSCGRPVPKSLA